MDRKPTVIVEKEGEQFEEQNINQITFATIPSIPIQGFTTAYQWDKLFKDFKKFTYQGVKYFCTPSADTKKELTDAECKEYFEKKKFTSFNEYIKQKDRSIKHIEYDNIAWQLNKCDCWYWCKNYHCKHVVAFANRKKQFDYKIEHKQIPIGANRKRGRPKKLASALEHQPQDQEFANSDTESDEEEEPKIVKSKRRKAVEELEDYDLFADDDEEQNVAPPRRSARRKMP